jgi:hypothetical protein
MLSVIMLNVPYKPIMLSVMAPLNVIIPSVAAPFYGSSKLKGCLQSSVSTNTSSKF